MGAVVAGATDIPGDAPKFMVVRNHACNWHPDGSLLANEIKDNWIVKFPRGKHDRDFLVLRNEAKYLEVARWFGVRVGAPLHFQDNALFIPRFDREAIKGKLLRHGLETLNSVAGIVTSGREGGSPDPLRRHCRGSHRSENGVAGVPQAGYPECGHAERGQPRSQHSFPQTSRCEDGSRPLYDFAAMYLDPEGIARATLWPSETTKSIGLPDWREVAQVLTDFIDPVETINFLKDHAETVRALPGKMKDLGIEAEIIEGSGAAM